MEPNRTNQSRNVRVRYEPGDYGLALSIYDVLEDAAAEAVADSKGAEANVSEAVEEDEGVLTVIKTGVTTLELRRGEGSGPSMLIWDEAEVDWATVQAG